MGRGLALTNTRSYSNVLMTALLVFDCAFIILAHVKCMYSQARIQTVAPSPHTHANTPFTHLSLPLPLPPTLIQKPTWRTVPSPSLPAFPWSSWWFLNFILDTAIWLIDCYLYSQDWFDKFEILQFEVHIHYLCLIHYAHISDWTSRAWDIILIVTEIATITRPSSKSKGP